MLKIINSEKQAEKTYIMLQYSITGMGGGQMYIMNKAKYMEDLGYKVYVFSGCKGDILVSDLKKYDKYIIPELLIFPFILSNKKVSKVLNKICKIVNLDSNIVVESGSISNSYWGELLAKNTKGRHLVFLLGERPDNAVPREYLDFYKFKFYRHELAGITDKSLKLLFRDELVIDDKNNSFLPAVCQNVVEDYETNIIEKIPNDGINLGIIGRMEKDYVLQASYGILESANIHPEVKFNVIYIGSSNNGNKEKFISKIFAKCKNVKIIFLGYIYPIPKRLFPKIDLFISSSGSASVSYGQNRPTISVDAKDGKAIGVLGYTTKRSVYRRDEPMIEISKLLNSILFENFLSGMTYSAQDKMPKEDKLYKHIIFMENASKDLEYFSFETFELVSKDKKKRIICRLLGSRLFLILLPFYSKIFGKKYGE